MTGAFDDPAYLRSLHSARSAWQAAQAKRETSAEESSREQSRSAYADASPSAAYDLAQDLFPDLLTTDLDALGLPRGVTVERYLASNVAELTNSLGKRSLLISTQPLAVDNGTRLSAVDLSLRARADDFVVREPATEISIPQMADDYVRVDDTDVGLRPAGAGSVAGIDENDRVFYPDVAGDTDFIAAPMRDGVRVMWQLRSADAPDRMALDLELPPGATLRLSSSLTAPLNHTAASAVGAEIVGPDGTVLNSISAPRAFDSDGASVAAAYQLVGGRLAVDVAHHGHDVKYPILVDPEVREVWGGNDFYNGCNTPGARNWHFQSIGTPIGAYCNNGFYGGTGLYIESNAAMYSDTSRAQWSWGVPGYVKIMSAWLDGVYHTASGTHLYNGIMGPYGWEAIDNIFGDVMNDQRSHVASPGNEMTAVVFGLWMDGSWVRPHYGLAAIHGANIRIGDTRPPSSAKTAHAPTLTSTGYAPIPEQSPWINPVSTTPYVTVNAYDQGLGIRSVGVVPQGNNGQWIGRVDYACQGFASSPCAGSVSQTLPLNNVATLSDGITAVQTSVVDVTDNWGPGSLWYLRLDRSGPGISLSGDLWDHRAGGVAGASTTLHVRAVDGDPANPASRRSGVQRISVLVDGVITRDWGGLCAGDSCSADVDAVLPTSSLVGHRTITIRTTDNAGNSSTQSFNADVYPTSVQYGNSTGSANNAVDTDGELEAVIGALGGIDDATAPAFIDGLSAVDQDRLSNKLRAGAVEVASSTLTASSIEPPNAVERTALGSDPVDDPAEATAIAAGYPKRGCRRTHDVSRVKLNAGLSLTKLDMGSVTMDTRFCWDGYKHTTAASGSPYLSIDLKKRYELIGYESEIGDTQIPTNVEDGTGYPRGGVRQAKDFDIKYCALFRIGTCGTEQKGTDVTIGRYTGTARQYFLAR